MHHIDQVIERLLQADELDIYEGEVTDSDIAELSSSTHCALPEDYIAFLGRCGFASWEGHSVYGIFDANDDRFPASYNYSAAIQTATARQLCVDSPYPRMDSSVVIGKDGMGGYYLLLSKATDSKHDVIWVNPKIGLFLKAGNHLHPSLTTCRRTSNYLGQRCQPEIKVRKRLRSRPEPVVYSR